MDDYSMILLNCVVSISLSLSHDHPTHIDADTFQRFSSF